MCLPPSISSNRDISTLTTFRPSSIVLASSLIAIRSYNHLPLDGGANLVENLTEELLKLVRRCFIIDCVEDQMFQAKRNYSCLQIPESLFFKTCLVNFFQDSLKSQFN